MNKIQAICIDAENKPAIIPDSKWIVKDEKYTITHIYKMVNQDGIQGCDIAERDISAYIPYNCFKLERFAFREEDLPALFELIKDCTSLNEVNIQELIEQLELQH